MIFPDLDVAENIFVSHQNRPEIIDWRGMRREAEAIIARLGVTLDVSKPASTLTLAEQQTVEIARAISLDVRVLIMDEPSASLSDHEVRRLFGVARALRDAGVAVVYISHRLEEVFELADRVSVMRDGRHISTRPVAEVDQGQLVTEMVGRDMAGRFARRPSQATGETMLAVRDLGRDGVFEGVSLRVEKGEIVCLSGLVGARRTDIALALFGIAPADSGRVEIDGADVVIDGPRRAQALGIVYVSEDRRKFGLAMAKPVTSNITLATLARYAGRLGLMDRAAERRDAAAFRDRLAIKAADLETLVGQLSGGNQQKVMLAKWLNLGPDLLIVDEPTRGIDVGAKAEVHDLIRDFARQGGAVLAISSDLPEVLAMGDRILVMREGRQMAILDHGAASQERIMALATGQEAA
jgi:rhamnose transport system ATP-binding protein